MFFSKNIQDPNKILYYFEKILGNKRLTDATYNSPGDTDM